MAECVLCNVILQVEEDEAVLLLSDDNAEDIDLDPGDPVILAGDVPPYEGEYEFTPSDETQVAMTNGKYMMGNVIVHPIPSNYGKITYNGRTITVS